MLIFHLVFNSCRLLIFLFQPILNKTSLKYMSKEKVRKTWKVKLCLRLTKNKLRLKLGQAQVEVEVEVEVGVVVGVGVEDGVEVEVILLFRVAGVEWLDKL